MALFKTKTRMKLLAFLLSLGISAITSATELPAFLPEFAGGVKDNAIWRDTNFFQAATQCNMQYQCGKLANELAKMKLCQAQAKTCMANYMSKQGASEQAVAFARYNSVPSTIDQIKRYNGLDVVYAKMQWADASGGFFIITKKGFIVPTFNIIKIDNNASFRTLLKKYPNAMLWNGPDNVDWPAVQKDENGIEQVVFKYPVKDGCHACADVAYAKVAYNFDRNGKYLGTKLLKIVPVTAQAKSA